jgi:hypothetical protein
VNFSSPISATVLAITAALLLLPLAARLLQRRRART